MLDRIWEILCRWRTWLFNVLLAALLFVPDVLNTPEVIAVVPPEYQKYIIAAAFLINVWMRPRPAVMAKDLEK